MPSDTELPKAEPSLLGLGSLIMVLDRRYPGLAKEWEELVDSEFMRSREVIEIRAPQDWAARRTALHLLSNWARKVVLASDAHSGWRKRRKKAG